MRTLVWSGLVWSGWVRPVEFGHNTQAITFIQRICKFNWDDKN